MDYYARHAGAVAATQGRLGGVCPLVTWDGKDWAVIPGSAVRRADLAPGGFQLNADFRFEVLVAPFLDADRPTVAELKAAMLQTSVGYLGDEYKAISVAIRPGGQQILVECNSMGQGA